MPVTLHHSIVGKGLLIQLKLKLEFGTEPQITRAYMNTELQGTPVRRYQNKESPRPITSTICICHYAVAGTTGTIARRSFYLSRLCGRTRCCLPSTPGVTTWFYCDHLLRCDCLQYISIFFCYNQHVSGMLVTELNFFVIINILYY